MHFEKKISVGDLVAILMAIVAIVGLGLQARSTSISEQQLKTEIDDISAIVANIEEQRSELTNEQIGRLRQGEELYKSQSEMHKQLLDIGRYDRQISDMYLRSLMLSQSTLHVALLTVDVSPAISELLTDGRKANAKLATMLALTEQWRVEMQKISLAYEKKFDAISSIKPVTSEILEKMSTLNDQLMRDIALLNGRYAEKLEPIREDFVSAQEQLVKKLARIYGATTQESANK
jgi:hypothetical protein